MRCPIFPTKIPESPMSSITGTVFPKHLPPQLTRVVHVKEAEAKQGCADERVSTNLSLLNGLETGRLEKSLE